MKTRFLLLSALLLAAPIARAQTIELLPGATTPSDSDLLLVDQSSNAASDVQMTFALAKTYFQNGAVLTSGSYSDPAWITHLSWSKLLSTPTTLSGYGITDPIALTSGSYANPSWITSLAASKVTGLAPSATTDTTNATNITSGTLPLAQIPTGTSSSTVAIGNDSRFPANVTGIRLGSGAGSNDVALTIGSGLSLSSGTLSATATPLTFTAPLVNTSGTVALTIGSSGGVQAYSANLASWSGLTPPSSTVVGISDTQTLTNKSIASSEITGLPTFPSGTIVGTTDTQTLTNKSIAGSEINSGTVSASYLPTATTSAFGLVKPDGSTITISSGVISAASSTPVYTVVSAGGTTVSANSYVVLDAYSGGAMTTTLPGSPSNGQWVTFIDILGSNADLTNNGWANYNQTISGGARNIFSSVGSGTSSTFVLSHNYEVATFVFYSTLNGWMETDSLQQSNQLNVQTGTLSSGSATKTVPSGCHPWVVDTASTPNAISVTVSGTTATIHGTGTDTFTLFNYGSN